MTTHQCPYVSKGTQESRKVRFGTASDRYGDWQGQIYHQKYTVSRRPKKLRSGTFVEEVLPVNSVVEYFEHFDFVEIDYTFYNYLLDDSGNPTTTFRTLDAYAGHLPPTARVVLKVPQAVTAKNFYRGGQKVENKERHDAQAFAKRFYDPAQELLGERLAGMIFEHEYTRKDDRPNTDDYVKDQQSFFAQLPKDQRYQIEERTEALKSEAYWTYLPSLAEQFQKAGEPPNGVQIIRLLTPKGMRYEDAYSRFHPFDKLRDEPSSMIQETVQILEVLTENGIEVLVTANNRAGGNAPEIIKKIVQKLGNAKRS